MFDDFGGYAAHDTVVWHIAVDDSARRNDDIVADMYAGQNNGIPADSYVVSDRDRADFGDKPKFSVSVRLPTLPRIRRMVPRIDTDIGCNGYAVADLDRAAVENGASAVDEYMVAKLCMHAVENTERFLHGDVFAVFTEQFAYDLLALFGGSCGIVVCGDEFPRALQNVLYFGIGIIVIEPRQ